jgi:hypothetical protein
MELDLTEKKGLDSQKTTDPLHQLTLKLQGNLKQLKLTFQEWNVTNPKRRDGPPPKTTAEKPTPTQGKFHY